MYCGGSFEDSCQYWVLQFCVRIHKCFSLPKLDGTCVVIYNIRRLGSQHSFQITGCHLVETQRDLFGVTAVDNVGLIKERIAKQIKQTETTQLNKCRAT